MRHTTILSYLGIAFIIFSLSSCLKDTCDEERQFFRYVPVFTTIDEFRTNEIEVDNGVALENPGKLYYYNDFLFITEIGKGVHIYDNSDKNNPVHITYYNILGCEDISIKNGIMYADHIIDLISIDISDILNPRITHRLENYENERNVNGNERIVAYFEKTEVTQSLDCSQANFNESYFNDGNFLWVSSNRSDLGVWTDGGETTTNSGGGNSGVGGSTARFTIVGDVLYVVDVNELISFSITEGAPITQGERNNLGWNIETIFPYKEYLFIGSQTGMFIYSIENPLAPSRISSFDHGNACDPVVTDGSYAYVTLRSGTSCRGGTDQLDIINIEDIRNPKLVKTYPMKNPHGLAVNGNTLYLSEGEHGLKILDITDKKDVKEISFDKNLKSVDVIYLGDNTLLSIGSDGFHQLDVSNPKDVKEISHIQVQ